MVQPATLTSPLMSLQVGSIGGGSASSLQPLNNHVPDSASPLGSEHDILPVPVAVAEQLISTSLLIDPKHEIIPDVLEQSIESFSSEVVNNELIS